MQVLEELKKYWVISFVFLIFLFTLVGVYFFLSNRKPASLLSTANPPLQNTWTGYLDDVGRHGFQQIFTIKIGNKNHTGFYFLKPSSSDGLDPFENNVFGLIFSRGTEPSRELYIEKVQVYGHIESGQLCEPIALGRPKICDTNNPCVDQCKPKTIIQVERIVNF